MSITDTPAAAEAEATDTPELEHVDGIVAALAAAQGEFPAIEKKATAIIPAKNGKSGYSYKYADLGDVLATVRPVLSKHGLALIQRTTREDGKAVLVTELRHVGGGVLVTEVDLGQTSGNPQAFGGALTYLRRYEAVTLLGIAAEEDRDAQDVEPAAAGQPRGTLPAWAGPASRQRIAEANGLVPVLGQARTRAVFEAVKGSLGEVPDVVVNTAKLIAGQYTAALDELGLLDAAKRERVVLEEKAAQAAKLDAERLEAEAAQAAAEAPDTPAPEPTDEPPTDGPPAPTGPAPGTVRVDVPDGANEEATVRILRGAGCTCEDPLAAGVYEELSKRTDAGDAVPAELLAEVKAKVDVDCPVAGHGIAF